MIAAHCGNVGVFAGTVTVMYVVPVRLPEVPVMATVTVPGFAVGLAVRVRVLVEVAGFGLKAAVTPDGSPEAASVTLPENPLTGSMVIVLVPLLLWRTVREFGKAERVKPWVTTVRLIVVVLVNVPDVPVICTVTVPGAATALAVRVIVLVEEAGFGLKVAVTPLGSPEAERVTLPVKPLRGTIVIMVAAEPLCPTVTMPGLANT